MMAVAEPSLSLDLQRSPTTASPRPPPPRTLSPISKRGLPSSFQRPFIDPPLQALPSIEAPQTQVVVKTEGQATSGTVNEFLPVDLLQTLKRQSNSVSPRGVVGRHRHTSLPPKPVPAQSGSAIPSKAPAANLWNYSNRRSKLKYLTDAPPCICGTGKDISFLYDADLAKTGSKETTTETASQAVLPSTLVPEEYHVVKHPGMLGLEFHDDPYVTRSEDHDHHMTVFPSMRPSGRHEAVTLKYTLDTMLKRAGVPNVLKDADLKGPTAMHNLLELLQKEQTIYNICFHELIRQVSVHCVERGELLADVRRRYNNLLDRIPRQVKSLHDELVAQRALDRKLSTELRRFKGKISTLTDELSTVKEHDLHVTEQSRMAEDNLTTALADSEKNANLLAEYHALYELQRTRLEDQVSNLTFERDIWQQASYDLAQRVAEECNLQTLQRLQLCEKSWCKLAGHFAVILSDKDTQQLSEIQGYVQKWRERVVGVTRGMLSMERKMKERLDKVEKGMQGWSELFDGLIDSEDGSQCPSNSQIEQLFADVKIWQDIVNEEAENFTGDTLVSCQEELGTLRVLMEQWTEVSVKLFTRHQEEGEAQSAENGRMQGINASVDGGLKVYAERISGENGVATGFIHIMTPLETWDTKLSLCLSSQDRHLPLSDWIKFRTLLKEWTAQVQCIVSCIGTDHQTKTEGKVAAKGRTKNDADGGSKDGEEEGSNKKGYEESSIEGDGKESNKEGNEVEEGTTPLSGLISEVEKWRAALSHAIDSNDTLITTQVCRLHSSLVKLMVELLLRLTSTLARQDQDLAGHKQHIVTTADLKTDYTGLAENVANFTKMLMRKCVDVVRDIVDKRIQEDYPNPEEEQVELKRLGDEMEEWVKLAGLLLQETETDGEQDKEEKGTDGEEQKERKESSTSKPESTVEGDDEQVPEVLPESMSVVGIDDNIHPKSLQQVIDETEPPPLSSSAELGLATEDVMPEGRQPPKEDIEALIMNLDEANKKLEEQEEKTKEVEERAQSAEKDLEEAKAKIAELETELQQAKATIEQQSKNSSKGSRSGSRNSTVKRPAGRLSTGQPPGTRPTSRK